MKYRIVVYDRTVNNGLIPIHYGIPSYGEQKVIDLMNKINDDDTSRNATYESIGYETS